MLFWIMDSHFDGLVVDVQWRGIALEEIDVGMKVTKVVYSLVKGHLNISTDITNHVCVASR